MSRWYEVKLKPDSNDTWLVTVPAFPEVTTFGSTQQDACEHARDAIEEAIAGRISDGDDIPPPLAETSGKGFYVELPLLPFFKAALYMIARAKKVSRAELARLLTAERGKPVHREQVDRLFRLDHNSQFDQIEAAFKALGVPIGVNVDFDAAA